MLPTRPEQRIVHENIQPTPEPIQYMPDNPGHREKPDDRHETFRQRPALCPYDQRDRNDAGNKNREKIDDPDEQIARLRNPKILFHGYQ